MADADGIEVAGDGFLEGDFSIEVGFFNAAFGDALVECDIDAFLVVDKGRFEVVVALDPFALGSDGS